MNLKSKIVVGIGLTIVLTVFIWLLWPLFGSKVETQTPKGFDSLNGVLSSLKKEVEELRGEVKRIDELRAGDFIELKNDLQKIKKFTPSTRAAYLDSLFRANHVK